MFGAAKPTGFGAFGAPTSAAPTFGFGTPATGAQTGFGSAQPGTGLQFGAPTASTSGLQFGLAQPAQTGFQLGAATQPAGSFGTATTLASVGFSGGGMTFGTPVATSAPSLFGTSAPTFGAPAATSAPGLSFNLGATTSTAPLLTGFSLGAPTATSASGLSFGAPKTTAGLSFGTSAAPTLGFGTAASSAPSFNFALSTPATAASGFSLGGTGTLGVGSSAVGLSTATATTTVGLGGVDSAQSKLGLLGTGATEPKQAKDHALPAPILQNFNDFQAFVKQQKGVSVDIAHSSAKPLKKVQEDIESIESLLANITSGLARNSVTTEKLKNETAHGLFHADMAQRLRDSPNSLAYESGPEQFFAELVLRFETDAARLLLQVEAAERHLRSITQSSAISPQELTLAMRRLHETMVVLAARTQSLHLTARSALEEYRHLRHVYLKEDFPAPPRAVPGRRPAQRSLAGPTPFSETSGVANLTVDALSMLTGATIPPAPTNTGWLGAQSPGSALITSPASAFLSPLPVENSAFQLAKPPVGNKRNKR